MVTDLDLNGCDSGLDTPPSTHRPSSYRDVYYMSPGARDSTDTGVSSSRGTLVSPGGSIRGSHNGNGNGNPTNTNGSRYSVQEKILRLRNEEDRHSLRSTSQTSTQQHKVTNECYHEINQNSKYLNGNGHIHGHHHNGGSHQLNSNGHNRERYQNPALAAIINESQGIKFRGEI